MKKFSFISIIIILNLLLSSCADSITNIQSSATIQTSHKDIPEKDTYDINFEGTVFTFAILPDAYNDVYADESSNNKIDKNVAKSNKLLYDYYNCKIEAITASPATLFSDIAANDIKIDFLNYDLNTAYPYKNSFYDIKEFDIDLNDRVWDTELMEQVAINKKLYAAIRVYSKSRIESTSVLLFNENVRSSIPELEKIDFYDARDGGLWSLDYFLHIIKLIPESSDICTFASSMDDIARLFLSSGKIYSKIPYEKSEAHTNVINILSDIYSNESTHIVSKAQAQEMMENSEVLFILDNIRSLQNYTSKKIKFGVLPLPSYSQEYQYNKNYLEKDTLFIFALKTDRDISVISDFLTVYGEHSSQMQDASIYEYYAYVFTMDTESSQSILSSIKNTKFDEVYAYGLANAEARLNEYILSEEKDTELFENIFYKSLSEDITSALNKLKE